MPDPAHQDVIIMGGGLAGLSLAIHLARELQSLQVLVLDRSKHPVPAAVHKVGESTVEIGAHYFDKILDLHDHLVEQQLKKFGFRFFFSDGREDIDQVLELGASTFLPTPAYQLDRGIFENFLAQRARSLGVRFFDGATVRTIEVGKSGGVHQVSYERDGVQHDVTARWLVDASGRAGLMKRQLDLAQGNAHDANAVWFRMSSKLDVDHWSTDRDWLQRCDPPRRWLSTVHLCGEGYWVWLIPLASGSHSVGIVCDAKTHPLETMSTFETALEWLRQHQPRLAREIDERRHLLQDFRFLRNFSYGCKQVYSGRDRWALTGEAGVFLDPFYSPGSDFIAIGNTYIVDLIRRECRGERPEGRAHIYQQLFFSFYESTLSLYTNQYSLFGDPEGLSVKVIWDYTYYWGILCQIFFQDRLMDMDSISALSDELNHARALNATMQEFLRQWSQRGARSNPAIMLDQASWPWFRELNRGLRDELSAEEFRTRVRQHTALMDQLANEIVTRACGQCAELDSLAIRSQLRAGTGGTLLFDWVA